MMTGEIEEKRYIQGIADEIADAAIDHFSTLHPNVRMNKAEWADLHEMIEREVRGNFERGCEDMSAADLLPPVPKAPAQ
jgi:hypothetical protein